MIKNSDNSFNSSSHSTLSQLMYIELSNYIRLDGIDTTFKSENWGKRKLSKSLKKIRDLTRLF